MIGGFSKVVATFSRVGVSLKSFYSHHLGCLNNPIMSNLGLCAVCWAHFMCHYKLWPTSVGHPFSFLNSSWGLTGGKHYQKEVFRFVLQNFTIPAYFPYILFYSCLFSLLFSGWLVIAVCGSISDQGTNIHTYILSLTSISEQWYRLSGSVDVLRSWVFAKSQSWSWHSQHSPSPKCSSTEF